MSQKKQKSNGNINAAVSAPSDERWLLILGASAQIKSQPLHLREKQESEGKKDEEFFESQNRFSVCLKVEKQQT